MKKWLCIFVICFPTFLMSFEHVVIWGHKFHTNTCSYIYHAFYRAFKHLGYKTYWLNNEDDISSLDLSKSLFIVEGQDYKDIPLLDDGFYILHNCPYDQFSALYANNQCIALQVYTDDVLKRPEEIQIAPAIYINIKSKIIHMPWATDLLPHEIEAIQKQISIPKHKKTIAWVGTIGDGKFGNRSEIISFMKAAKKRRFTLIHKTGISIKENVQLVNQAAMAPTIVGAWQKKQGYIPCRIFKNISYGQLGITNSYRVNELFEGMLIYDSNPKKLFQKAYSYMKKDYYDLLMQQMNFVKENHTYINRIETLLDFIEQVRSS